VSNVNAPKLPRFAQRPRMADKPGLFRRLTESQARVLLAFDAHGDMTDYQLGYAYRLTHGDLDQSWSGLRTRRCELVDAGVLEAKGEIRNENNRKVTVWGIAGGVYWS
jgi:hypothetical protein